MPNILIKMCGVSCVLKKLILSLSLYYSRHVAIMMVGEFKHEVRQFEKSYDNQQAEQISLMV